MELLCVIFDFDINKLRERKERKTSLEEELEELIRQIDHLNI